MKTRDRILATAIRLFNERGAGPVSTNHIAEAAGISPGNLYYHFPNKEAIIRAAFEQLFAEWDVAFALPDDRLPTLEDVQGLVRANFRIMSAYRFVYRELLALLLQDAELHQRYLVIRQRGFDGFRDIFAALHEAGVMHGAEAPERVTRLAELCWLISEFWLATVELRGEPLDEAQFDHGVTLMMDALQPYIAT